MHDLRNRTPLSQRVIALCDEAGLPESHLDAQVHRIRSHLAEPLRIALGGRRSQGKSTCVNALLGAEVAPVGSGGTTRVVCRFEHGDVESAFAVCEDGTTRELWLTKEGRLPEVTLDEAREIKEVIVRLPYAATLREATIIDTPGISGGPSNDSHRAIRVLVSIDQEDPLSGADALLILLEGHGDEAQVLADFHDLAGDSGASTVNAIGIINKADALGQSADPMADAWRKARTLAEQPKLRSRLATVVPLVALIAATVETGNLNSQDTAALAAIAAEDPSTTEDLLDDGTDFLELDAVVSQTIRADLLRKLGIHGIRIAVQAVRAGRAPLELSAVLQGASGLTQLRELVGEKFIARADVLKAERALSALERLSYQTGAAPGTALRARIEQVRLLPEMHAVREAWAINQVARREVVLPEELESRLVCLVRGATPAARVGRPSSEDWEEIRAAALAGAKECLVFANRPTTTLTQRSLADTMRTSYTLILSEAMKHSASQGQAS